MGVSGDDMASRASNSGSVRNRFAGLSTTARPAITRECNYANETDPRHPDAGGGRCCGGHRRGTNCRGRADGDTVGRPGHSGDEQPGCPRRLPRRRRPRRRLPRRLWRRSLRLPRRSRRLGLAMGVGPALVAVDDDGGSGITRYRFRHIFLAVRGVGPSRRIAAGAGCRATRGRSLSPPGRGMTQAPHNRNPLRCYGIRGGTATTPGAT